jgi:hypothetical protein
VVGLLLDCDAGRLTVKNNGKRLGVAATGLTGELCCVGGGSPTCQIRSDDAVEPEGQRGLRAAQLRRAALMRAMVVCANERLYFICS